MFKNGFLCAFFIAFVLLLGGCGDKKDSRQSEKGEGPSVQTQSLQSGILAGLRKEHPRLLFTAADQRRIEELAEEQPFLAEIILQLKNNAKRMLSEPVVEYKPDPNFAHYRVILLLQARACVARVLTLAMTYRLTGDNRFFERARQEMLSAAAFKDWNPGHFLDVAEFCCALAIGYDWLYDKLSPGDRKIIRQAIVTKALEPGLEGYGGKDAWGWWSKDPCNWNLVCNGGLTLGALAVAEDEPEIAEKVISHTLQSVLKGMASYKPDGAWPEGAYWEYATAFSGLMIASLDSALGKNFGLAKTEGFDKTGLFQIHMVRPSGHIFSYGDCVDVPLSDAPAVMFWLARKFDRPEYAWFKRKMQQREIARQMKEQGQYTINYIGHSRFYIGHSRFYAMSIAWFDERNEPPKSDEMPLDVLFRGRVDTVAMRSAWDDEQALYVGFKGGDSTVAHAHLDIGSFVLEADSLGWAIDLGRDKYHLPGYFKAQRWNYYRCGSKSHNTLVIGDKLQRVEDSESKVIDFLSTPARAHAVVDMTNAYRGQAAKVLRGVAMLDRSAVLVQDEITCLNDDEIRWGMVTPADIKLDGAKATLTQEGRTLSAEILSPAGAKFEILSTAPPTEQENPNKGASMLAVFVKPQGKGLVRLAILLTPIGDRWQELPPPQLEPLSKWKHHTKGFSVVDIISAVEIRLGIFSSEACKQQRL